VLCTNCPLDCEVFGVLLLQMNKPAGALEKFSNAFARDPAAQSVRATRDHAEHELPVL